ncbi:MAG: hypothetical protein ACFFBI_00725 [Promethearchaeota archaeon]
MKIIGIVMILIGISLIIAGIFFYIISLNSMGNPGSNNFMLFGGATAGSWFGGGVCIIIALILLIRAYQREIVRYGYEETGMALGTASEEAVNGYGRIIGKGSEALARGIKSAGGLDINTSKEQIIKIKCRACGTLNDEDAKYCDQCGQPI